jgi:U3 small nucleolar RNA-associated protein 25
MRSLKRSAAAEGAPDSDADTASDDEEDGDDEGGNPADGNDSDGERALPRAVDEEEEEAEEGGADALLGAPATSALVVSAAAPGGTASGGYATRVGRLLTAAEAAALAAATDKAPSWTPVGDAMPGAALAPLHGPRGVTSVTWEVCGSCIEPPHAAALQLSLDAAASGLPSGLATRWLASLRGQQAGAVAPPAFASPLQGSLWGQLQSYKDVLYTARSAPPVPCACDPVLDAVLLHALGHCLAGRAEVLRHNERLRAKAKATAKSSAAAAIASAVATGQLRGAPAAGDVAPEGETPQDQGFTRPKLLVLCPTRAWAKRWLDRALHLLPCANTGAADCVSNAERWEAQYGPRLDEAGKNPRSTRHKPADFCATFFGNRDDHFRVGVKLTARSVRLFADFVGADIVLASPLGLATRLEAGDASFLSSIELCILDGADVMLQQNWAHVETVFGALNGLPTVQDPSLDVMRVRPWYLDGHARHYRQTVVLSAHAAPQLSALLRQHCANWAGKARLRCTFGGVLSSLGAGDAPLAHGFTRVSAPDAASAADARFAHFKTNVWPRLSASAGGELLLVPSYFDFVRLRNFLAAQGASFATYCEYTDPGEVGAARRDFGEREAKVMVHTQRAWFFRRHVIRGAARVTFYGPPDVAECYAALATALAHGGGGGAGGEVREVETLFTRWDAPSLERIVGTKRCAKMLAPGGSGQFLFC